MSGYSTSANIGITVGTVVARKGRKLIDSVVRDHRSLIDNSVITASAAGFTQTTYELPTQFNITNMPDDDAKLYVYSELIDLYSADPPNGKGFDVTIEIGRNTAKLVICWPGGLTTGERQWRQKLISEHRADQRQDQRK